MLDASRILLAHSYYLRRDAKQREKMKPYPPLGTLLAAAVLRKEGYEVGLFDAMLAPGPEAFAERVARERPLVVGIFEDNFNFLTKMCTVQMREATVAMIRAAKGAGARVAVNGSDATDHPERYLEAGADAVIVGEVEAAAVELFAAWTGRSDASVHDVPGLALPLDGTTGRSLPVNGRGPQALDGRIRRTLPRTGLRDLDALPLPAWDLVDHERYRRAWTDAHGRFSWNVVTSRGCPYGCNWCAKPVFGRRYAQRSPEAVAEEIARLREEVAPDHLWFADDIFGLTVEWIEAFGDEVARRNAATPFMVQSRVNLMAPEACRALKRAGCEEVWMGVESGSQRILDAMDKGSTVAEARDATRNLRAAGVGSGWFVQLGYPGEEWEDILATRDLVREERPDDVGVSVSYPLPGTPFFERVRGQLGTKRNWEDSDELAMMFQGTFRTPFYRSVRALLHDEVREIAPDDLEGRRRLDQRWERLGASADGFRSEAPTTVG